MHAILECTEAEKQQRLLPKEKPLRLFAGKDSNPHSLDQNQMSCRWTTRDWVEHTLSALAGPKVAFFRRSLSGDPTKRKGPLRREGPFGNYCWGKSAAINACCVVATDQPVKVAVASTGVAGAGETAGAAVAGAAVTAGAAVVGASVVAGGL